MLNLYFCKNLLKMQGKKYLLIGLVFGVIIGWVLGFLRLPYIEKNYSFLLGFIAALVFVSLLLLLLATRNKDFLHGLIGKKTAINTAHRTRTYTIVWTILVGIVVLGGVVVYNNNRSLHLQIQAQKNKIRNWKLQIKKNKNDKANNKRGKTHNKSLLCTIR